jgi:hypothetical protein
VEPLGIWTTSSSESESISIGSFEAPPPRVWVWELAMGENTAFCWFV